MILFTFIGITPIEYRSTLETSASSLRSLTAKERKSIKQRYVKIVKAKANETIEGLSKRTGNKLNIKLTAIINSVNLNEKIKEGILIKIVLEKSYLTK